MKVTKKITTTIIGELIDGEITRYEVKEFTRGVKAKKAIRDLTALGRKVFIDSITTKKCVVELEDEFVINNARIEEVENEE